jgi:hypothetical protein
LSTLPWVTWTPATHRLVTSDAAQATVRGALLVLYWRLPKEVLDMICAQLIVPPRRRRCPTGRGLTDGQTSI